MVKSRDKKKHGDKITPREPFLWVKKGIRLSAGMMVTYPDVTKIGMAPWIRAFVTRVRAEEEDDPNLLPFSVNNMIPPDHFQFMYRMAIVDGVLTKEARGNYPERFEFISGAIPDGTFIPGCDRIDEMTDRFADDIEQYGAGEQLRENVVRSRGKRAATKVTGSVIRSTTRLTGTTAAAYPEWAVLDVANESDGGVEDRYFLPPILRDDDDDDDDDEDGGAPAAAAAAGKRGAAAAAAGTGRTGKRGAANNKTNETAAAPRTSSGTADPTPEVVNVTTGAHPATNRGATKKANKAAAAPTADPASADLTDDVVEVTTVQAPGGSAAEAIGAAAAAASLAVLRAGGGQVAAAAAGAAAAKSVAAVASGVVEEGGTKPAKKRKAATEKAVKEARVKDKKKKTEEIREAAKTTSAASMAARKKSMEAVANQEKARAQAKSSRAHADSLAMQKANDVFDAKPAANNPGAGDIGGTTMSRATTRTASTTSAPGSGAAPHSEVDERVQELRAAVEAAEREATKAAEIRRLEERLAALKAQSAEGEHGLSGKDSSLSANDEHDSGTSLGQPSSVHRDAAGVSDANPNEESSDDDAGEEAGGDDLPLQAYVSSLAAMKKKSNRVKFAKVTVKEMRTWRDCHHELGRTRTGDRLHLTAIMDGSTSRKKDAHGQTVTVKATDPVVPGCTMATAGRWLHILTAIDVCHKKSCCTEDSTIKHALANHPLPNIPLPDDTPKEGEGERTWKTAKVKGTSKPAEGKGAAKPATGKGARRSTRGTSRS